MGNDGKGKGTQYGSPFTILLILIKDEFDLGGIFMVSKVKNKYKQKHIKFLQYKNLTITKKDKNNFEIYLLNYGA
ncbi:MAG: hypothetical protein K2I49_03325 [Ureaplasma sp.]|nr:hypothetical protein [Ureaplasma sp.]